MKEIRLPNGAAALVDDEDYEALAGYAWHEMVSGGLRYAIRDNPKGSPRTIMMHRQIMSAPAGMDVDHWDNDGLNNRRANLRVCTRSQNAHNRHGRRRNTQFENSTSARPATQYRGVYKNGRSFIATVGLNGKANYLGSYPTPEAAALAYNQAIIDAGLAEFAPLNVITEEA